MALLLTCVPLLQDRYLGMGLTSLRSLVAEVAALKGSWLIGGSIALSFHSIGNILEDHRAVEHWVCLGIEDGERRLHSYDVHSSHSSGAKVFVVHRQQPHLWLL
eukprot:1956241-Amphidinium_carterae.2